MYRPTRPKKSPRLVLLQCAHIEEEPIELEALLEVLLEMLLEGEGLGVPQLLRARLIRGAQCIPGARIILLEAQYILEVQLLLQTQFRIEGRHLCGAQKHTCQLTLTTIELGEPEMQNDDHYDLISGEPPLFLTTETGVGGPQTEDGMTETMEALHIGTSCSPPDTVLKILRLP